MAYDLDLMFYTYLLFHKHFFPSSLSFSFLRRFGVFLVVSACFFLESFQQAILNFSFAIAHSLCLHWSPSKVSFIGFSGLQIHFGVFSERFTGII